MFQEMSALIQLGFHISCFERDECHIIPFLPILKKLIIKPPPFTFKNAGFDEMLMKSSTDPGMLLKG